MRRFGQNCDDVLTKRSEQVARYCCMDRATSIAGRSELADEISECASRSLSGVTVIAAGSIPLYSAAVCMIASFGQNIITVLSETVHV
jgi:hypothetical protein